VTGWVQPAALWFGLAATGGLRVETTTPDALCPELGEVRRAVEARLGDIEGEGEWLASYALVHHPDADAADVVRLQLRDPSGRVRLQRDLPRAGASCKAVGQALVVVLDAYFRRPADAASAPAAAAPPADLRAVAAPSAAQPPARPLALGLGVAGAWAAGPSSPAVALEVWLAGRSGWGARLQGAWLTERATQPISGSAGGPSATMHGGAIRAGLGARLVPGAPVELRIGPEALLVLEHATSTGLQGGGAETRAAWGVGMSAGARVRLAERVALSLDAAGDYTPPAWGGIFAVKGPVQDQEVFKPARFRFLVGAGVSLALFP
jgi:hypothetical protein